MTESSTTKSETIRVLEKREKKKQHLWKAGQSGNPTGRPKGAKNKVTMLKQAVLLKAEELVLTNWEEVVQTTLTLAKEGDSTALKILWDRMLPSVKAVDGNNSSKDKLNITINVQGMEVVADVENAGQDIEEADYEEINET